MKKAILFALFLPALVACTAQYNAPICDLSSRVDYPGIEGTHYFNGLSGNRMVFKVTRTGIGTYLADMEDAGKQDQMELSTCRLGTEVILEAVMERKSHSAYFLRNSAQSIELYALGFDVEGLKKAGVSVRESMGEIRVNNKTLADPTALKSYFRPSSYAYQLSKSGG